MKHQKKIIGLFIFFLLIAGCGYHLVGTGNTLPPHLKSIAIPVFKNSSSQPEIHRELTSIILRSFVNDGRLKLAKKNEASFFFANFSRPSLTKDRKMMLVSSLCISGWEELFLKTGMAMDFKCGGNVFPVPTK